MRIQCDGHADFLENIRGQRVFNKTIFVNRSRRSLTDDPPRTSHSVEIILQLSAVITYPDGAVALVESGESCGEDCFTVDGKIEGTPVCETRMKRLDRFCEQEDLTVKPGILDM